MKKLIIVLTALICLLTLASCVGKDKIPEGEYELTVVEEDYISILCEPLKKSYKPGETVIVKTGIICDAGVKVTLNGEKAISHELVEDENGRYSHHEWKFIMPAKHSYLKLEIVGFSPVLEYGITVNDKLNAILNDLEGQLYCNGEKVIIRSMRNDLIFETTPNVKISAPELIKNENGGFSHYEYSFKMPSDDLTINVDLSPNEPTLWDFSFNDHTGIENLFITDFMEEYAEGDVIEIDVNPDALIEDRGIILKANGVLVEGKNEWCVLMPSKPLKIDAYLINSSFGENWKYLNIIDKDDLLANFADGYYQVGKRVVVYTDYLIDIISEDGIQIDGLCVDDGEGIVEYIYSFEMPNSDLTVEITRQENDNNNNE